MVIVSVSLTLLLSSIPFQNTTLQKPTQVTLQFFPGKYLSMLLNDTVLLYFPLHVCNSYSLIAHISQFLKVKILSQLILKYVKNDNLIFRKSNLIKVWLHIQINIYQMIEFQTRWVWQVSYCFQGDSTPCSPAPQTVNMLFTMSKGTLQV